MVDACEFSPLIVASLVSWLMTARLVSLAVPSEFMHGVRGATTANIPLVGFASSRFDHISVMFAVLWGRPAWPR